MIDGVSLKSPLFVNTVGHVSGALLFGVLLLLLIKGWGRSTNRQRGASLIAAFLGFAWNAGSLAGLASAAHDGQMANWLVAVNFSVLSLLPPVLFKVVLRQRHVWL